MKFDDLDHGINFNDLPNWHKRGFGLYWEVYHKQAQNPLTGETVMAARRRIKRDFDLPLKDEYARFIMKMLNEN